MTLTSNLNLKNLFNFERSDQEFLESGEKVLWRYETAKDLKKSSKFFHYLLIVFLALLSVMFFSLLISFLISILYLYTQDYSILLKTLIYTFTSILFFYCLYKFAIWGTKFNPVINFYITDKKLVFLEPGESINVFYFSEFEDIDFIEDLNQSDGVYKKFLLKSNFYSYFKNKLFKTYKIVYLDEKGLEILIKLLKEKAPYIKINL